MPITQARVIALLEEYEGVETEGRRLRQECEDLCARVASGQVPPSDAFSILQTFLLTQPLRSRELLRIEARHFSKERNRNERKRAREAQRRMERRLSEGFTPSSLSAPASLITRLIPITEDELVREFNDWNSGQEPPAQPAPPSLEEDLPE